MRRLIASPAVAILALALVVPSVAASPRPVPSADSMPPSDAEGPLGSVAINGGDLLTTSLDVTLSVPAEDADGVASVKIANDGDPWTVRDYAPTQAWTLNGPAGHKKVWVRWVDGLGNETGGSFEDTIKYDPEGVDVFADDASATNLLVDTPVTVQVQAVDRSPWESTNAITFAVGDAAHGAAAYDRRECEQVWGTWGGQLVLGQSCTAWITFRPDSGFVGTDTFEYTATDAEGLSDTGTVSVTYVNDTTAPSGTVQVYSTNGDAGSGYTNTTSLLVRVNATDTQSNFGTLRLSNSSTTSGGMLTKYVEFPNPGFGWNDLIPWSLSNATGGSTASGNHTIYAQWSDAPGNWSTVKTSTIKYDTTLPTISAVTIGFATSAANAGVPIRISFTPNEVGAYFMQRSVDGGAYANMNYDINSKKLDLGHSTSHSYRYRVRVRDGAGNWGPWKYSITFKPAYSSQNSSAIAYSGSWSSVTYVGTGWTTRRAKAAGAYAKYTFTGKGVSYQAIKGPGRGKAQIYIDGTLVKTIDLYSSAYSTAFVYSKTWSSSSKHTIRVRVLGTSGRPYVDIDGFGVLK